MHRPRRYVAIALGQQAQHGVIQESPRRQHRQAPGFVDYQQITVVVEHLPLVWHRWLLPGGAPPAQLVAAGQGQRGANWGAIEL